MRGRLSFAAALCAAILVAATGAGTTQARTEGTAKAAGPTSTAVSGNITLAHWASSPTETELLKDVIAAFEKKYPQIKVRRQALDPYPDQMLARFAARKPADVFYVDSNVMPDWIKQGVLEPLNGWIARYKFRTKPFYPRLLSAFRDSKGRIYGFPKDWSPLGMQISNDALRTAGVAAPKNWTELQNVARRMITTGAVPGGAPICIPADWARLLAFVYQNGGSFLNASKTAPTLTSPATRQAVEFYVNLVRSGSNLAKTPAQLGVNWCGEALGRKKAGIIFEGNWVIPYMASDFPGTAYTNYPMVRNKQAGNLAFTVSYSMARHSKNKAAAWTLLTYLTSKEGMRIWTSKGLALPSRSDVKPVAGRGAFVSQAGAARPWQFAPGFAKVITTAGNELSAVFEGKTDINGMLQKIQAEAAAALRRNRR
jgi:multiple sugar transport system substrate-binding protein